MDLLSLQLFEPAAQIVVDRRNVLSCMLPLYDGPMLPLSKVKVHFLDEDGDDQGGLTTDLYTLFWRSVCEDYFKGDTAMVPHLPVYKHGDELDHFVTIGRMTTYMIVILKCIPPRLSRCSILCLALGANQVSDDVLLGDFR